MGIYEKAKELTNEIMATKEYGDLKQARSAIESSRELKGKMDDFKTREQSLYNSRLSAAEAESRAAELNKIFQGLSRIPEIDRFIKAEKEFLNMLNKVYKTINDTLESRIRGI